MFFYFPKIQALTHLLRDFLYFLKIETLAHCTKNIIFFSFYQDIFTYIHQRQVLLKSFYIYPKPKSLKIASYIY